MSDIHKYTSPNAIQLKNQCKTSSMEEKLEVISHFEKCEWAGDVYHNVRLNYSVCTIRDSADRIKEGAISGTKGFV
jgi:hypothetical protein